MVLKHVFKGEVDVTPAEELGKEEEVQEVLRCLQENVDFDPVIKVFINQDVDYTGNTQYEESD